MLPGIGDTIAPERTAGFARPEITTRSSLDKPAVTTRRLSSIGPSVTGLNLNLVIRPHRINDFATLIRRHGRVRDEQGFDVATEKAQTPKSPGRQQEILIVHHRPSANGARLAVELVVDEVHPSVSYPLFLIC